MFEKKTIRKYYNKEYITLNSKNNEYFGHDNMVWEEEDFPIEDIISKIIKVENLVSMEHNNESFGLLSFKSKVSEYIRKVCWCVVWLIRELTFGLCSQRGCCCRKYRSAVICKVACIWKARYLGE